MQAPRTSIVLLKRPKLCVVCSDLCCGHQTTNKRHSRDPLVRDLVATADMSDILSITASSPKLKRYRGYWTLRKRSSFQSISHSTGQRTERWQGHGINMPFHVFKSSRGARPARHSGRELQSYGQSRICYRPRVKRILQGRRIRPRLQRQDVPRSEKYTGENSIRYLQLPPLTIFLFSGSRTRQF